jgi:hypothetical protein
VNRGGTGLNQERQFNRLGSSSFQLAGNVSVKLNAGDTFEVHVDLPGTVIARLDVSYIEIERRSDTTGRAAGLLTSDRADDSKQYLLPEYRTEVKAANGDFTSGSFQFTKIGNVVTITATSVLTHGSNAGPSCSVGFIPEWARPSSDVANVYWASSNGSVLRIRPFQSGQLELGYQNVSGGFVRNDSFITPTISYIIT